MRIRVLLVACLVAGASMLIAVLTAPSASAAPAAVESCQTLSTPGDYALSADIAVENTSCLAITASDVHLDLAGHTISCAGSPDGFAGSCQVPASGASQGIIIASNLTGVVVTGPGTITGFDTGVAIQSSTPRSRALRPPGPPVNLPLPCASVPSAPGLSFSAVRVCACQEMT